jgi:hypothetical protein
MHLFARFANAGALEQGKIRTNRPHDRTSRPPAGTFIQNYTSAGIEPVPAPLNFHFQARRFVRQFENFAVRHDRDLPVFLEQPAICVGDRARLAV